MFCLFLKKLPNLVISNIKHYELSIEKVLKSCSPCKKIRNEK